MNDYAVGFQVSLLFLWLPSEEMAVARVAERVAQGGHDIPEPDIRRRYQRGLTNLTKVYLPLVDRAWLLNAARMPPSLVWTKQKEMEIVVDFPLWKAIQQDYGAAT